MTWDLADDKSILVLVMACYLLGTNWLPEQMLTYCQLDPLEQIAFFTKIQTSQYTYKFRLQNVDHFVQTSVC